MTAALGLALVLESSWATIASIGTFLVIVATAIATVMHMREVQAANKVAAMKAFFDAYEGPELADAFRFVRNDLARRLDDPDFRNDLKLNFVDRAKHPELRVCNFFDQWGLYVRDGSVDRTAFLRSCAGVVDSFWRMLEPAIALMADPQCGNTSFQQFEYLTIQSRRWLARHPAGDYPTREPRIKLPDV